MKYYDSSKETIIDGFGLTEEKQKELAAKYFSGSRAEILDKICNDSNNDLSESERCSLLIEFGSRLVLDEVNLMAKEHEKYMKEVVAPNLDSGGALIEDKID